MKFINTDKLSPIINYGDLPWAEDYFHLRPEEITKEFLEKGFWDIDDEWWDIQDKRCREGYTIKNGIDFGGDVYRDEKEAFWNDSKLHERYVKDIDYTIPVNSCYIPMYDLLINNKELHITGRHYFYLNFNKIYALDNSMRERTKGNIELEDIKGSNPPIFTDVDWGFYIRVMNIFRFKKDTSEAKGRQFGYSHKGGIGIAAWNFTFVPKSQTVIAGGMSDDADRTFAIAREALEELKNTQFYKQKKRGGDRSDYLKAQNYGSEIYSISCKDNTQALSRLTPYLTILEEEGKWKKGFVASVVEFNKAAQQAQGKKTGYNIHIGTGGDMEMGAADLEELHYNPDDNGILSYKNIWEKDEDCIKGRSGHFTPGWQFKVIDKDGNSNRELGMKYLDDELAKRKDSRKRYIYSTQNPKYAADAFTISSGGFFGENIVRMLNERKAYIITHKDQQKEKIGRLEWVDPKHPFKGCNFFNDDNGTIHIFEEPKLDKNNIPYTNLYVAGTDSYDQDESLTSNSKGDIRIFKTFYDANESHTKFVAKCTDRPLTSEGGKDVWYENTAKLCIYYSSINLIEHSKILIMEWYKTNGFEDLLKERPGMVIAAMVKSSMSVNKYGIDTSTKIHWLTKLRKYLEIPENIESMDDVEQITAFAKFRYDPTGKRYNCDTTIASSLCIVCYDDDKELEIKDSVKKEQPESGLMKFVMRNGNLVRTFN